MYFNCVIYNDTCLCAAIPTFWPTWIGGNEDFKKHGQPFDKMIELRKATMLEF